MIRAALLLAAVACGGCGPPVLIATASLRAAQFGTSAYFDGQLEAAIVRPYEEAALAAREVLADLEFELTSDVERPNALYLRADEIGWREIKVSVHRKSPRVTKINIRVGILGDQAMSRLILSHIFLRLGEGLGVHPDSVVIPDASPPQDTGPDAEPGGS